MMNDYVYLECLIEDKSGAILLERILENYKITHPNLNYKIKGFRGIGRLPNKLKSYKDVKTQSILNNLPAFLKVLNASLSAAPYKSAIIVIVDNDDNDCVEFKQKFNDLRQRLNLNVESIFCIAVEEMEAWLLGDVDAVLTTFPHAKKQMLLNYKPDSIIGTWEYLADAVYNGGSAKLKKVATSNFEIGKQKCIWADKIGANMDLRNNKSPSFNYLISKLDSIFE
ncbi:DUF4276 family protein [Sedimentibacter sp.]|uniref:DUF4276 family protein n=1 Tax=Sedimentibacter sp. TaxID=1960295 RepID=UPI0028980C7E|nr:DUF4276 family protein [Sedimentibacter sp.]